VKAIVSDSNADTGAETDAFLKKRGSDQNQATNR
jgi:hypothetical protein